MILGGSGSCDSWRKWFPSFLGEVVPSSGQPSKLVSNEVAVVARYMKSSVDCHLDGDQPELGLWAPATCEQPCWRLTGRKGPRAVSKKVCKTGKDLPGKIQILWTILVRNNV